MTQLDEIKCLIKKSDYVSFDVFDTLIVRPFWKPYDLFYFLGIYAREELKIGIFPCNFVFIRKRAEEKARIILQDRKRQDISLNDIYFFLQEKLALSDGMAEQLKQAETELEFFFCYGRKYGISVYKQACLSGRKIAFLTDMYLPAKVISLMLEKVGIPGPHDIFVSGEYGKTKGSGDLFLTFMEKRQISDRNRILHFGDNPYSDFTKPGNLGIPSFLIPNSCTVFAQRESVKKPPRNLGQRCRLAIQANESWDNPFSGNDEKLQDTFSSHFDHCKYAISRTDGYPRRCDIKDFILHIWMRNFYKIFPGKQRRLFLEANQKRESR